MDQINLDEYNLFNDSKATLKETSADTRDNATTEYMVYSEMEVINFDVVKTKYMNSLSASEECAKSCDALAQINNDIIFIEFKNGSMKNKKKNGLFCKCWGKRKQRSCEINQMRTAL